MLKTHNGQHGDDCFGCKIQGIQIHPAAIPSRTHYKHPARTPDPAWERGIPTDSRGMPFLEPGGTEALGQKKYSELKPLIEDTRRRRHQAAPSIE